MRTIHNAFICVSLSRTILSIQWQNNVHEKIKKPEPRRAYTLVLSKYQFSAGYDICMCILQRSMQHHNSLLKLTMPSSRK